MAAMVVNKVSLSKSWLSYKLFAFFSPGEDNKFLVLCLFNILKELENCNFFLGGEGRIMEILSGDL